MTHDIVYNSPRNCVSSLPTDYFAVCIALSYLHDLTATPTTTSTADVASTGKKAGDDKRLSKELERQLSASLPTRTAPSRSSSTPTPPSSSTTAAAAAAATATATAGGDGGGDGKEGKQEKSDEELFALKTKPWEKNAESTLPQGGAGLVSLMGDMSSLEQRVQGDWTLAIKAGGRCVSCW